MVFLLQGYGDMSLGNWCPTFKENVVVLFSGAEMPKTEDFATLEENDTIT
jgi:hypothetical protein